MQREIKNEREKGDPGREGGNVGRKEGERERRIKMRHKFFSLISATEKYERTLRFMQLF